MGKSLEMFTFLTDLHCASGSTQTIFWCIPPPVKAGCYFNEHGYVTVFVLQDKQKVILKFVMTHMCVYILNIQ